MESPPTQNRSGASGVGGAMTGSTGAGGASVVSVSPSAVSASFWARRSATSVSVPWFLPRASSTPLRNTVTWKVSLTEAMVLATSLRQPSPFASLLRSVASALRNMATSREPTTRTSTRPAGMVPSCRALKGRISERQSKEPGRRGGRLGFIGRGAVIGARVPVRDHGTASRRGPSEDARTPVGSRRERSGGPSELEVDEGRDALRSEGVDQDEAGGQGADLQERCQLPEPHLRLLGHRGGHELRRHAGHHGDDHQDAHVAPTGAAEQLAEHVEGAVDRLRAEEHPGQAHHVEGQDPLEGLHDLGRKPELVAFP